MTKFEIKQVEGKLGLEIQAIREFTHKDILLTAITSEHHFDGIILKEDKKRLESLLDIQINRYINDTKITT